jgi:hypothetical protein
VPLKIPPPPPAFLALGFNATVTQVLLDRNATGQAVSARGGPLKDPQPVQGAGPYRCYAEPYVDRNHDVDRKPGEAVTWFLLVQDPAALAWDRNYQVVVAQDGSPGTPHTVTLTGKSRDETGQGLYTVAEGVEYVA